MVMTRDDIIRMAKEDGMPEWLQEDWFADPFYSFALKFANLIAAAEREACAEVCELMYDYGWLDAKRCAREIRARREK